MRYSELTVRRSTGKVTVNQQEDWSSLDENSWDSHQSRVVSASIAFLHRSHISTLKCNLLEEPASILYEPVTSPQ